MFGLRGPDLGRLQPEDRRLGGFGAEHAYHLAGLLNKALLSEGVSPSKPVLRREIRAPWTARLRSLFYRALELSPRRPAASYGNRFFEALTLRPPKPPRARLKPFDIRRNARQSYQ